MIRPIEFSDKQAVIDMMRVFYHSEAVLSDGSEEIYENDVDACLSDSPYLEGYVFKKDDTIAGYAMLAKSFSTEFGKPCIWIEDLYLKPEYHGQGLASAFFSYIENKYKDVVFRLEAETENAHAVKVYEKKGYTELPYLELIRK